MARKTLYLIDGHSQIYRAYYAPFGNLTAPTGEPTRAIHVFIQMLLGILRDRKPDYLAMVMDVSDKDVFRTSIAPDYKANRQESPEDLGPQIDRIVSILQTMKVPIFRMSGYEADDLIATLCRRYATPDLQVVLVSKDKDLDQLLGDHVLMYDPGKDREISVTSMREEKGYGPELAVEAQMLMGDSTDNVRGVLGVGPKKAAQLLQKYGSVDAIIAHADELTPKLRENILEFAGRRDIARQLVTLKNDVSIEFNLESCGVDRFQPAAAVAIFEELGLTRLLERVGKEASVGAVPPPPLTAAEKATLPMRPDGRRLGPSKATEAGLQLASRAGGKPSGKLRTGGLFDAMDDEDTTDLNANSPAACPSASVEVAGTLFEAALSHRAPAHYERVDTESALAALASQLAAAQAFAFDTETTGMCAADVELVGLSFSDAAERGWYVPVRGVGQTIDEAVVVRHLKPVLENPAIRKCGQNLKYDLIVLKNLGIRVANVAFDSMIASFVHDSTRPSHGLDALARDLLRYQMIPITELLGRGKDQITFDKVPTDRACEYSAEDADITWRVCRILDEQMTEPELRKLFTDVEMPLVEVLADMEHRGVAINTDVLARLSGQMADRLNDLREQIYAAAGRPFNVDSTKQLGEVLFDERKLRVVRRTKTSRSTDAEVLETLAAETNDPVPKLVIEYRELAKLKGTYIDALPEMVCKRTGRIHPSFHQAAAVTGRLSCSDPNLQNIPIRTETGAQIRRAIVPGLADHLLLKADYSQIELRVLAHFSGDKALRQAFAEDRDIHAFVASQIGGIPLDEVTKQQRGRAKTVNFGIVYGQSAFGLSKQTGMSQAEARLFIEQYFARYPGIRGFLDECIQHARRHGYVKTLLGRRREIRDINSRNQTARNAAERFAVNTVVQGSAADMIKRAMINIARRIEREKRPSRMLLQVHDELVFEIPQSAIQAEAAMIAEEMSGAIRLDVPIRVDVAAGMNWLDMEMVSV